MFGQPLHFAIVGPSGSGKSTALDAVKDNFPGLELQKQLNYTTRKMRKKEIAAGSSDYIHTSVSEYFEAKDRGDYIGYRETTGEDEDGNPEVQNYGGLAPHVNKIAFITDQDGLSMLQQYAKESGERIVGIFFDAPKELCHERMTDERGEAAANSRTAQYETFLPGKEKCDYIIDANKPLQQVVMDLYEILQAESMNHVYPY